MAGLKSSAPKGVHQLPPRVLILINHLILFYGEGGFHGDIRRGGGAYGVPPRGKNGVVAAIVIGDTQGGRAPLCGGGGGSGAQLNIAPVVG